MKDKRNWEIVKQVLVPEQTLVDVGKMYGISKQRVDQIFQGLVGRAPNDVKKDLLCERADTIRCLMCGDTIPWSRVKRGSDFCSNSCGGNYGHFDMDKENVCEQCGVTFIPRNKYDAWQHVKNKYCSVKCSNYARREVENTMKICVGCGVEFLAHGDQKFCSHPCYTRNQEKRG